MPEGEQAAYMNLASSLESTSSLISQLEKAYFDLQDHKNVSRNGIRWEDVEGHFRHLESAVKNKLKELEVKQKLVWEKEALLAERVALVADVEQNFLEKVQELKDVAVSAITEARKAQKVSSSVTGGKTPGIEEVAERVTEELTRFCERMDAKGILGYVTENVSKFSCLRKQLGTALGSASDPASFVLDALQDFVSPQEMIQNGDVLTALRKTRNSCILLMEALFAFLENTNCGNRFLTPETKHRAKAFADEWKHTVVLDSKDAINGESLEARALLWLLVSFQIASEFEREDICKFVIAIAHHGQAIAISRSLDMNEEMPGIVQKLIDAGRHIDAFYFVMRFQLSDAFPPAPLLRTYMEEVRKSLIVNPDFVEQYENNVKELAARKAVMRCVKEHKFEKEHPLDPLRKGFIQLQNAIRDNKSKVENIRNSREKEADGANGFYDSQAHLSSGPPPYSNETIPYPGVAERYPYAGPSTYSYPVPSPSSLNPFQTLEQRPYSYPNPAPGAEPRPYYYGQDDRVAEPRPYYYGQDDRAAEPRPYYYGQEGRVPGSYPAAYSAPQQPYM